MNKSFDFSESISGVSSLTNACFIFSTASASSRSLSTFNSELKIHLDSLLDLEEDYEKQRVYNEMIAVTISSLNEKQKDKFQGRLNTFIKSIDKIIKSQQ